MSTINREELREELIARGFQYVADEGEAGEARLNRYINQAIREICDYKPWPFLMATEEGTAPLKVEDLGHVEAFLDVTNDNLLRYMTLQQLMIGDADLSTEGTAEYWYTEDSETLKVYPANTSNTFKLYYRKTPADLSEDSAEPIIPSAYDGVILDAATSRAYKLTDNYEAASAARRLYREGLEQMIHALLHPNYDFPRRVTRTGWVGDYLSVAPVLLPVASLWLPF